MSVNYEGKIMKLDKFTKVLLTFIAIFLGIIAFDYKPNIEAKAGIMGGNEMIAGGDSGAVFHLKDGRVRFCSYSGCGKWMD